MRPHAFRRLAERPHAVLSALLFGIVATGYGPDSAAAQEDCHYYDDGSIVDVLVLYTAAARLDNSSNDIDAYIRAHVDTMNSILEDSGASPRIQVVHTQEVAYNESGLSSVDDSIDRMLNPGDGYLDGVHALRDTYRADVVLLFVKCVNCGGVAACNRPGGDVYILDQSGGFLVLSADWPAVGPLGTAHEMAHVMGCGHNRDAESSPGLPRNCRAYPYSYGHDFIGDSGNWSSTVMSYGPTLCGGTVTGSACQLVNNDSDCPSGQTCEHLPPPKIPYYSNPDILFDGRPTGVPAGDPDAADCVLTIDTAAFTIANYRQRPGNVWVDFAYTGPEYGCFEYPFNTLDEGVANVPEGGTLIFKSGSGPETGVINKRVTLKGYGGTVRIGE